MRSTSWSCSTAIAAVFFQRQRSFYFDVAQSHCESLELLTEGNKLLVGLDVLLDLHRLFPVQSLSYRLSPFLPGMNPIRPPHEGLPFALTRYLQVLLGHRPSTHGAEGSHLLEDSLPLPDAATNFRLDPKNAQYP